MGHPDGKAGDGLGNVPPAGVGHPDGTPGAPGEGTPAGGPIDVLHPGEEAGCPDDTPAEGAYKYPHWDATGVPQGVPGGEVLPPENPPWWAVVIPSDWEFGTPSKWACSGAGAEGAGGKGYAGSGGVPESIPCISAAEGIWV